MSKADFTVKRERYGHVYELSEHGEWLKDGVPFEAEVKVVNGVFWLFDGSAGVGELKKDMGLDSNTWGTTEIIDYKEEKVPEGIDKISRVIYRTKKEGMYCVDKHWVTKADRVTYVRSYSTPAPFEKFAKE